MRPLLHLLPALLLSATPRLAQASECTAAAMEAQLTETVAAYSGLPRAPYRAQVHALEGLQACLSEPLPPELVARVHLVMALEAGERGDLAGVEAACSVAFAADAELDTSPALGTRDGSEVDQACEAGRARAITLGEAPACVAIVNGTPGAQLPADAPALVQTLGPAGGVQDTQWLALGADFACPQPPPVTECTHPPAPNLTPLKRGTAALTLVSLGATGALGAATLRSRDRYFAVDDAINQISEGEEVPQRLMDDLDKYRTQHEQRQAATLIAASFTLGVATPTLALHLLF